MYVHSMTGFANASAEAAGKRIELELRSVNHRFLDVQFKMPEDCRFLEGRLREQIAQQVARGKLECRILLSDVNVSGSLNINQELVDELAALNQKFRKKHKDLGKLTMSDVLRFPGVIVSAKSDNELLGEHIVQLLEQALSDFVASRRREGEKLQQHIVERLDSMLAIITALEARFPQLLSAHKDKVRRRLAEALTSEMDTERLSQEFALFMQKADVDEEFNRLRTHIEEVRRIVSAHQGSKGKRLDFLMQELNREANTLGSKAIASECTQASVELKVLIEQMREQVQNIE